MTDVLIKRTPGEETELTGAEGRGCEDRENAWNRSGKA